MLVPNEITDKALVDAGSFHMLLRVDGAELKVKVGPSRWKRGWSRATGLRSDVPVE
ncbi:hypothetical protein [Streptomyces sp. TRM68367]|uniref:hypothetical protein n=1 Tax=Streptomyces sp. TRM68367 TaxID=2758415 RepID=UPI00165B5919|nr:hypothetical protein [Streptomyces sp. TRM68367]MBC9730781.1 hypothetical protein [Streptomyces sp. TRM68367]